MFICLDVPLCLSSLTFLPPLLPFYPSASSPSPSSPSSPSSLLLPPQAKFAIGDLTVAKSYTLRAMAAEKDAKFVDEKQAAKDSKDLMDKINAILGERQ